MKKWLDIIKDKYLLWMTIIAYIITFVLWQWESCQKAATCVFGISIVILFVVHLLKKEKKRDEILHDWPEFTRLCNEIENEYKTSGYTNEITYIKEKLKPYNEKDILLKMKAQLAQRDRRSAYTIMREIAQVLISVMPITLSSLALCSTNLSELPEYENKVIKIIRIIIENMPVIFVISAYIVLCLVIILVIVYFCTFHWIQGRERWKSRERWMNYMEIVIDDMLNDLRIVQQESN